MKRVLLLPCLALAAALALVPAAAAAPAAPATFVSPSGTSIVVRAMEADGRRATLVPLSPAGVAWLVRATAGQSVAAPT